MTQPVKHAGVGPVTYRESCQRCYQLSCQLSLLLSINRHFGDLFTFVVDFEPFQQTHVDSFREMKPFIQKISSVCQPRLLVGGCKLLEKRLGTIRSKLDR